MNLRLELQRSIDSILEIPQAAEPYIVLKAHTSPRFKPIVQCLGTKVPKKTETTQVQMKPKLVNIGKINSYRILESLELQQKQMFSAPTSPSMYPKTLKPVKTLYWRSFGALAKARPEPKNLAACGARSLQKAGFVRGPRL